VDEKKKPKKAKKPVVVEVVGSDEPSEAESKRAAVHWDPRFWRRLEGGSW